MVVKTKFWVAGSLLTLACAVYYFTSVDSGPSVPEHSLRTPDISDSHSVEKQSTVAPTRGENSKTPAAEAGAPLPKSDSPLPAPISTTNNPPPDRIHLWQTPEADASVSIDGVPGVRLQVNPEHLRQLHLGQTLVLDLPDSSTPIESALTDTYNDPGGVEVWQGYIDGEVDEAAVIISRGKTHTHMIIASEQGNYSVVIDNQTGESTLIDEGYIQDRQAPIDDAIYVDPPDSVPLPSIQ